MRWAKTTKYQASLMVDFKAFSIVCEGGEGEDYALSINGEYIRDVQTLPTYEELVEEINQQESIEEMTRVAFPNELVQERD